MARLIASLPMYDWPEISPLWDRLWNGARHALEDAGIDAPQKLSRGGDDGARWRDPNLLVGQTCGWPFISRLGDAVLPFARFDFGLGGAAGDYHSVFVQAHSDISPAGVLADPNAVIAINSEDSQSGFRVLSNLVDAPTELPLERFLVTGSHRASIRAVASGQARLAAIDAVSWRLALVFEPAAAGLAVAGRSANVPGLPLIAAPLRKAQTAALRDAIGHGVSFLPPADRAVLGITGVVEANPLDYAVLLHPPFGLLTLAK